MPSALAAGLGKYAIPGVGKASVVGGAQSLVGWVLWQKLAAVAALIAVSALGTWTVANYAIDGDAFEQESSVVQAGTADENARVAIGDPQESEEVVAVPLTHSKPNPSRHTRISLGDCALVQWQAQT